MRAQRTEEHGGLLTLEEFERLPEEGENRLELVQGRLVREPRPGAQHGTISAELFWRIESHARERGLGQTVVATGFLLTDDPPTVRGPDVAFICQDPLLAGPIPTGFWTRAPDLAVEVVSPSNAAGEIQQKVLDYLAAGSRLVWVVDPRSRSVTAYRSRDDVRMLMGEDVLEGADVLPGLRIVISDLFAILGGTS